MVAVDFFVYPLNSTLFSAIAERTTSTEVTAVQGLRVTSMCYALANSRSLEAGGTR